jgi:hypothetical protein
MHAVLDHPHTLQGKLVAFLCLAAGNAVSIWRRHQPPPLYRKLLSSATAVCLGVTPVGKPDAGNPLVPASLVIANFRR